MHFPPMQSLYKKLDQKSPETEHEDTSLRETDMRHFEAYSSFPHESRPLSAKVVEKKTMSNPRRRVRPISAKRNIINAPTRPSRPDTQFLSRLRPNNIIVDKERLYDQILSLKVEINAYKSENIRLRTKISQFVKELSKRDEVIEEISNSEKSPAHKQIRLVVSLKKTINEAKAQLRSKEEDLEKLKKNLKVSKISELEIEVQTYMDECVRLRQTLAEVHRRNKGDSSFIEQADDGGKDAVISGLKKEKKELAKMIASLQEEKLGIKGKIADGDKGKKKVGKKDAGFKNELKKLRAQLESQSKGHSDEKEELLREMKLQKRSLEDAKYKLEFAEKRNKEMINEIEEMKRKLPVSNKIETPKLLESINKPVNSDKQLKVQSKKPKPTELFVKIHQILTSKKMIISVFSTLIDKNNNGLIEIPEFIKGMKMYGKDVKESEISELIEKKHGKSIIRLKRLEDLYEKYSYSSDSEDPEPSIKTPTPQPDVAVIPRHDSSSHHSIKIPSFSVESLDLPVKHSSPTPDKILSYFKHISLCMQLHRLPKSSLHSTLFLNKPSHLSIKDLESCFTSPPFTFIEKITITPLCEFLIQPSGDKVSISTIYEKLDSGLKEWSVFEPAEENEFDSQLTGIIANKKADLKKACREYDKENHGVIELSEFRSALNEAEVLIGERLFDYMMLLFYSHEYEIDKVPYKNFVKAYGEPIMENDHYNEEEKIRIMKHYLSIIAQSLNKNNLTVKEAFKCESFLIYPDGFIAGLELIGLKNIENEAFLMLMEELQYENEVDNCIHIEEFEKIMERFGVPKKAGLKHRKSFSNKGSSENSLGSLKKNSLLESEFYEYSEDSPDKFGISGVSLFASNSNADYRSSMSPAKDVSQKKLQQVKDEESSEELEINELKNKVDDVNEPLEDIYDDEFEQGETGVKEELIKRFENKENSSEKILPGGDRMDEEEIYSGTGQEIELKHRKNSGSEKSKSNRERGIGLRREKSEESEKKEKSSRSEKEKSKNSNRSEKEISLNSNRSEKSMKSENSSKTKKSMKGEISGSSEESLNEKNSIKDDISEICKKSQSSKKNKEKSESNSSLKKSQKFISKDEEENKVILKSLNIGEKMSSNKSLSSKEKSPAAQKSSKSNSKSSNSLLSKNNSVSSDKKLSETFEKGLAEEDSSSSLSEKDYEMIENELEKSLTKKLEFNSRKSSGEVYKDRGPDEDNESHQAVKSENSSKELASYEDSKKFSNESINNKNREQFEISAQEINTESHEIEIEPVHIPRESFEIVSESHNKNINSHEIHEKSFEIEDSNQVYENKELPKSLNSEKSEDSLSKSSSHIQVLANNSDFKNNLDDHISERKADSFEKQPEVSALEDLLKIQGENQPKFVTEAPEFSQLNQLLQESEKTPNTDLLINPSPSSRIDIAENEGKYSMENSRKNSDKEISSEFIEIPAPQNQMIGKGPNNLNLSEQSEKGVKSKSKSSLSENESSEKEYDLKDFEDLKDSKAKVEESSDSSSDPEKLSEKMSEDQELDKIISEGLKDTNSEIEHEEEKVDIFENLELNELPIKENSSDTEKYAEINLPQNIEILQGENLNLSESEALNANKSEKHKSSESDSISINNTTNLENSKLEQTPSENLYDNKIEYTINLEAELKEIPQLILYDPLNTYQAKSQFQDENPVEIQENTIIKVQDLVEAQPKTIAQPEKVHRSIEKKSSSSSSSSLNKEHLIENQPFIPKEASSDMPIPQINADLPRSPSHSSSEDNIEDIEVYTSNDKSDSDLEESKSSHNENNSIQNSSKNLKSDKKSKVSEQEFEPEQFDREFSIQDFPDKDSRKSEPLSESHDSEIFIKDPKSDFF